MRSASSIKKLDETVSRPGLVPIVHNPARRTSAVVASLPATAPSQSPLATRQPASMSGSRTLRRASSSVRPRCLRRSKSISAKCSRRASRAGRTTSTPLAALPMPLLSISTGRPSPREASAAAACSTRGSWLSGSTIRFWSRRAFSCSSSRRSIEDYSARSSSGTSSSIRRSARPCVLPCASVRSEAEPPPPRLSVRMKFSARRLSAS